MRHMPFKLGITPINWANDDLPDLGDHYSFEHIINDTKDLGYKGTELGRKFPLEKETLLKELNGRGLQLASKFIGTHFGDLNAHEEELQQLQDWIDFLKPLGVKHIIVCEMKNSIHWDKDNAGEDKRIIPLTENEWVNLKDGLHKAGRLCHEHGMELVYHPHGGTVVETEDELDKLMDMTDPSLVSLLYDSGHVYYGEGDPLGVLKKHIDRTKYVHFKDVRATVIDEVRKNEVDFRSAVLQGAFTVPGDGDIDFKPIIQELLKAGYKGWVLVEAEQDPEVYDPYKYGEIAKKYLDQIVSELR